MKKKLEFLIAVLASVLLITAFAGISVSAADSGSCGTSATWTLDDEGTLTISGEGAITSYSLSGGPWSSYSKQITKIVIEEGITTSGNYAFFGLSSLKEVSLPESLTKIGTWAFEDCDVLEEIVIPSNVKSIGDYAFYMCPSLNKITLPATLETMGTHNLDSKPTIAGYENSYAEVVAADNKLTFESLGKVTGEVVDSGEASDTISWSIDSYDHLVISGTGEMPVYSSSDRAPWYDYYNTVKKITVGEGITSVSEYAFYNMKAVVVMLPETLTTIENRAFYYCGWIDKMYIPASVTSIGSMSINSSDPVVTGYKYSYAYEYALNEGWKFISLGEVPYQIYEEGTFGENLTWSFDNRIALNISGTGAMTDFASADDVPWKAYKSRIGTVNIGEGVTNVGAYALANATNITGITLPESVGKIGDYAFYRCTNLKDITFNGVIESVGNSAFEGCSNIMKLPFKDGLKHIGDSAFSSARSLASVEFGSSLETIGKGAFYQTWIINMRLPDSVVSIGEGAFTQTHFETFTVPAKVEQIPASLFENASLRTIIFHDNVTSIGDKAFYQSRLQSLELPASLKTIGASAFKGCSGIAKVVIPEGVEEIGSAAFSGCSNLAEVTISSTVKTIGGSAFYRTEIAEIVFPDSVVNMGGNVLGDCDLLVSVKLPANITTLPASMFSGCSKLTEVELPEGITSIGKLAFEETMTGGTIVLPDSVVEICERAFFNCGATELVMSKNVEKIGEYAFSGSKFKSINIPGKVKVLGADTLRNAAFETVVLEEGITTIENNALYGLSNAISISLPSTLTTINGAAFASSGFVEITLPEGVKRINGGAFSGCKSLTAIYAPKSLTYVYSSAFKTGSGNLVVKGYTGSVAEYNYKLYGSEYNFGFESIGVMDESVVLSSGTDGGLKWTVSTPGVLTLSGSGATKQYSSSNVIPWNYYAKYIEKLVIEEGINYLSDWQEEKHTNLKEIVTHYSLMGIYDNFEGVVTTPVIKGYTNSKAHEAAEKRSFEFVSLGEAVDEVVYSGECGEATWSITSFGKLILSGEGSVSISGIYAPWHVYRSVLKELEICDGITYVPISGYKSDYFSFEKVTVSHSVETFYPDWLKDGVVLYAYAHSPVAESAEKAGIEYISLGDAPKKVLESGSFGENITWEYDNYKNLVIKGFGDMPDELVPWRLLNEKIENVDMSADITSIAAGAFRDTNITSFVIPEGVVSIDNGAFEGCSQLTSVTFPYSLVTVAEDAFWSTTAINSVTGYDGSFAERFANARSAEFTSLGEIPERVQIIGYATSTILFSADNYGTITFAGTGWLPDLSSNTSNDYYYKYSPWQRVMGGSITKLIIGEGIERVGQYNFGGTAIEEVVLPQSLESIGILAFNSTEISEIVIPENVVSVGYMAFKDCYNLQTVRIEGKIEAISQELFRNTKKLKRIQIPDSVTTIYPDAFKNSGIQYIYYGGTTTKWNNLTGVEYVPDEVTVICAKEMPDEATYEVKKVSFTSSGVDVTLTLSLMGGEGLYVAGYNEEGAMVAAQLVPYATGQRKISLKGKITKVKVFLWEDISTIIPVGEMYEKTKK